jgi:hypothetical protein
MGQEFKTYVTTILRGQGLNLGKPSNIILVSARAESNENLVTLNLESSCSAPNILTAEGVYRRLVLAILEGIKCRLDKPCHLGLVLDQ